jgi:hypothetical protein
VRGDGAWLNSANADERLVRGAFIILIGVHGLIHLLGTAKAFGWGDASPLRVPITPAAGLLWLVAAVLLGATATMLAIGATRWWWLGLAAVVLSQMLIIQSWSDAKFGTLANLIIVIALVIATSDMRPGSFRA